MAITTLRRRAQFLRVRGGGRHAGPAFVLEGKARPPHDPAPAGARFGFTVTKKLGKAVVRNRMRRRLKAAIAEVAGAHAQAGFDYVVVAREAALDRAFGDLTADLVTAFRRVHTIPRQDHRGSDRARHAPKPAPRES